MEMNTNAVSEFKKYVKAISYGVVLEDYNVQIALSANGNLTVKNLTDDSIMTLSKWLKSIGKTSDELWEDVKEELQEQLYEENKEYMFGLSGDEFYALLDYRTKEQGLDGDDDSDDERYEAMFVQDMSYSGVSLEQLVAGLMKERKRGMRNYSEKTKAKAVEAVRNYFEVMLKLNEWYPEETVETFLENVLEKEMPSSLEMTLDYNDTQELAKTLVNEFPQLCGKAALKKIVEEMNSENTIENLEDKFRNLLKDKFREFYKIVKEYESDDRETPYCQCKFRKPHRFTDDCGRKFSTKTMCLWGDEILIAKYQLPYETTYYSTKDYMWLIDEIPFMEVGKIKYHYAD